MARLLLDTVFLIDVERGLDLDAMVEDEDDVAVAAVTKAELLVGVLLASEEARPQREAFVQDVAASLPVVAYDTSVAAAHAELLAAVRRAGRPRGAHDLLIAATARATNRVVVTADAAAFAGLPGVETRTHR